MKENPVPVLYQKHFVEKQDERKQLFMKLAQKYHPAKGLYPGSFVHITPSFYIHDMTYVDMDARLPGFFRDEQLQRFLEQQKQYPETPLAAWYQADFTKPLPLEAETYDMLFSFYAGFISRQCKTYLKPNGILVCNNSHGDASLAAVDPDYTLRGVIRRNGDAFSLSEQQLQEFFQKKDGSPIDTERVLKRMIGENFTRKAFAYIFQKQ